MKITVGVKSIQEAEYYFANGADEAYCGLAGLRNNRRPCENFPGLSGAEALAAAGAAAGRKVFIAVNEILSPGDYRPALRLLAGLADKGFAGAIVRDPALLAYFKREKFRFYFVLSTLANCFNSGALDFYAGLGVKRLVLPMQLLPAEVGGLIGNKYGIETEVFCQALYYGVNVDSLCLLPCPQASDKASRELGESACKVPFRAGKGRFYMPMPPDAELLGALYDFHAAGVPHLKVARWPNALRELDVFLKVKSLLNLLKRKPARAAFLREGARLIAGDPLKYGKSFITKPFSG